MTPLRNQWENIKNDKNLTKYRFDEEKIPQNIWNMSIRLMIFQTASPLWDRGPRHVPKFLEGWASLEFDKDLISRLSYSSLLL